LPWFPLTPYPELSGYRIGSYDQRNFANLAVPIRSPSLPSS
jgi:hypothetical protein